MTGTEAMVIIPGGVEPIFDADHDLPVWSLLAWRVADDDDESADAYTESAHEWLSDGDDGEFYKVASGLTHHACVLLAEHLGLLPA